MRKRVFSFKIKEKSLGLGTHFLMLLCAREEHEPIFEKLKNSTFWEIENEDFKKNRPYSELKKVSKILREHSFGQKRFE